MTKQVPVGDEAVIEGPDEGRLHYVTDDVAFLRLAIVNAVVVGAENSRRWVLVDAGVSGAAGRIRRAAAERYGEDVPPQAIILTHGHFDHVGSLNSLLEEWNVPVFAHAEELPFLTGQRAYQRAVRSSSNDAKIAERDVLQKIRRMSRDDLLAGKCLDVPE